MSDNFHIETDSNEKLIEESRRHFLRARAVESVLDNLKAAVGGSFAGLVFQKDGKFFKLVSEAVGFVAIPYTPPKQRCSKHPWACAKDEGHQGSCCNAQGLVMYT